MAVSEDNKSLARYLRDVTQSSPTVTKYWDDAHVSDHAACIARAATHGPRLRADHALQPGCCRTRETMHSFDRY